MKSRQPAPSGCSPAMPASSAPALGAGNAAAQEALQKKCGGGTWTVESGDTLSRIAARRYGNAALWAAIRDANPDRVRDGGRLLYVGAILDIPEIDAPEGGGVTPPGGECPAKEPVSRVTEFGTFEIYADDYAGPLPRSADGVQRVFQWRFAQIEAEAESESGEIDLSALDEDVSSGEPVVVVIAGEQVRVSNKAEALHAAQIIKDLRELYGIRIDSQMGVDAIKARYTRVPTSELDKLRTKEWEYKELVGLCRALEHFAPILGEDREASSEAGMAAGVTSVSKVDQTIDQDKPTGKLDRGTMGEYFAGSKNLTLCAPGTDSRFDFADNQTQLEATAIHELAHGLMRRELEGYRKATGYWIDDETPAIDTTFAEQPITRYGRTSAREDLSEATMYYFVEPESLRARCPARFAYIDRVVSAWSRSRS